MTEGQCHCGAVQVRLRQPPTECLQCNCSLCTKTGWIGMFADPDDVDIAGEDACDGYVQGVRAITVYHCRGCGVTTHWTPLVDEIAFMGVNARLFDEDVWRALPVRQMDGKSR